MGNFVQRAQRAGRKAHARASAIEVTIRWIDGGPDTRGMRLVPGLRRAESLNENGVVVDRLISRWIGEREAFEKAKRLPKRGDRIITEAGDEYVVSHPAGGREYEFRDPYAESISIHSLMDRIRTVDTPIVTTIRAYGNGFGKIYGSGFGQLYGSA